MERFKVVERETKTKAYSKEGIQLIKFVFVSLISNHDTLRTLKGIQLNIKIFFFLISILGKVDMRKFHFN